MSNYAATLEPTSKEIRSIVNRALLRMEDPAAWCRKVPALDHNGIACDPLSDRATQWCASGHLLVAEAEAIGRSIVGGGHAPVWNKVHRHLGGFVELQRVNDTEGREEAQDALRVAMRELAPLEPKKVGRG